MEFSNHQHTGNNIINENKSIIKKKSLEDIINTEDIINFISTKFYAIIHYNKSMKKKQSRGPDEPLYSKTTPVSNINKYLIRIIKYTEIENNTLIVAYLYIIKLIKKENFILGINNVYLLLLGSVVLAKKVLEDILFDNSYYCQIGSMSNSNLNMIEYSLFTRIDFDVNLKKEDVNKVYDEIFDNLSQARLNEIFSKVGHGNINKEDN
jgi:hypothetical protein